MTTIVPRQTFAATLAALCGYVLTLTFPSWVDVPRSKRQLRRSMMAIKGSGLQLCTALPGTLAAITRAIKHMGLDGIVAKGQRSTYRSDRRGPERQKKRFNSQQEFAIGGYRPNGQDRVESLMVGVYEGSALKFVCKVRAGLDKTNRSPLRKALQS